MQIYYEKDFDNIDERTIVSIRKGSPADREGIVQGDIVISIDSNPIRDRLDFYFMTKHENEFEIEILRNGRYYCAVLRTENGDSGIELAQLRVRKCGNNCVFCFINQLPRGLRTPLYIHDEDFRYSFLSGSYITLTNITPNDWRRIIEQHMSPLYISVHTTDIEIREKLMGCKGISPIMEQLTRLSENSINFHTQIVVVPGYNDGIVLEKTTNDLLGFGENLLSLAIVPVGLTEHRNNLPKLRSVSSNDAKEIIKWHNNLNCNRTNPRKVQLADEFFIMADENLPSAEYYEEYPQYENGVGMVRRFLDGVDTWKAENFPYMNGMIIGVITGELFAPIFKQYAFNKLENITGAEIEVQVAKNNLFGKTITVANLLSGADIASAFQNFSKKLDILLVPPRVVAANGLFLDNWTLEKLHTEIDCPVVQAPENIKDLGRVLQRFKL